MSDRDWRRGAYLRAGNWPEAIPAMGPAREHGPTPWSRPSHHDPDGLDAYPASHPDAASCGGDYLGDVCPYCGTPLRWSETVVQLGGDEGRLCDLDELDDPTPSYHPGCWKNRLGETNTALTDFVDATP